MKTSYRTAPEHIERMPSGIPYIVGNEAAERFSFYGMKCILIIFMTKYLMDHTGGSDVMSAEQAKVWYHAFNFWVYLFPLAGALLADLVLGKYRTILWLSIVYCAGHLVLAMDETRNGLFWGLALIAVGSGGIKPCVSAHVGDQFSKSNAHLLERVFGWFYFSINLGAFTSTLLTPFLLETYGPTYAFGVPGILMAIATLLFWMGRNKFVHIPARRGELLAELRSPKAIKALVQLSVLYLFVAMFWALFDQTGSAWVLQAEQMDREFFGIVWLMSQIQAVNPIMILIFIPIFGLWLYPTINRFFPLTPIRKISIGLFITVPAFLLPAWIQYRIESGEIVNIVWQLASYILITAAEVFVSITCLEFSYTQAPKPLKSIVMALFLVSVSLGNFFVAGVNYFIQESGPTVQFTSPGAYQVRLEVSDGVSTIHKTSTLLVSEQHNPNAYSKSSGLTPPTVILGDDIAIKPGKSINLFATTDAGDSVGDSSLRWNLIDKPETSTEGKLVFSNKLYNTLQTDVAGVYRIELTFTVGTETATETLEVLATDDNQPPSISINEGNTEIQFAEEATTLALFDVYDPERNELTIQWSVLDQEGRKLTVKNGHRLKAGSILSETDYYLFFSCMMLLTALAFIPFGRRYQGDTYLQE
ncbi:MAG: MFS transporter [Rhodopirellula sp.]|nr:MFS transporter [Rhodopirellula sp.]